MADLLTSFDDQRRQQLLEQQYREKLAAQAASDKELNFTDAFKRSLQENLPDVARAYGDAGYDLNKPAVKQAISDNANDKASDQADSAIDKNRRQQMIDSANKKAFTDKANAAAAASLEPASAFAVQQAGIAPSDFMKLREQSKDPAQNSAAYQSLWGLLKPISNPNDGNYNPKAVAQVMAVANKEFANYQPGNTTLTGDLGAGSGGLSGSIPGGGFNGTEAPLDPNAKVPSGGGYLRAADGRQWVLSQGGNISRDHYDPSNPATESPALRGLVHPLVGPPAPPAGAVGPTGPAAPPQAEGLAAGAGVQPGAPEQAAVGLDAPAMASNAMNFVRQNVGYNPMNDPAAPSLPSLPSSIPGARAGIENWMHSAGATGGDIADKILTLAHSGMQHIKDIGTALQPTGPAEQPLVRGPVEANPLTRWPDQTPDLSTRPSAPVEQQVSSAKTIAQHLRDVGYSAKDIYDHLARIFPDLAQTAADAIVPPAGADEGPGEAEIQRRIAMIGSNANTPGAAPGAPPAAGPTPPRGDRLQAMLADAVKRGDLNEAARLRQIILQDAASIPQ